jgi:hypothetical protein
MMDKKMQDAVIKILSSKSKYYTWFLVFFLGIPLILYFKIESIPVSSIEPKIIIGLCSMASFGWSFIYLNLFVYAEIDSKKSFLRYGNLFRDDEVILSQVKYIGKAFFFGVHILRIKGVKYFLISNRPGMVHIMKLVS